ncbi:hypothetical protein AAVH_38990 [Aphelenchoides avenae]|nr:hypothetical protein AAVH_38990 [Aphelenchus avenae]
MTMSSNMDAFLFLVVIPTSGYDSLSYPFLLLLACIEPTERLFRFCPIADGSPESVGAAVVTLWPACVPFPTTIFWESSAEAARTLASVIVQVPRLRQTSLAIYSTGSTGVVHQVKNRLEDLVKRVASGDCWAKRIPLADIICDEPPPPARSELYRYPVDAPEPSSMPELRGFLYNNLLLLNRELGLLRVATASEIFVYLDLRFRSLFE